MRKVVDVVVFFAAAAAGQPVNFAPPQSFPGGSFPTSAVSGDFNKDGKLDLAVANQNGILILLGKGDGTFQPGATLSGPNLPSSLAIGDANNDGNLDLFAVSTAPAGAVTLSVFLGRGDGTFQGALNSPAAGSGRGGIAVGDFNADGKLDLAISGSGGQGGSVNILLGKGDGTFSPGGTYPAGLFPFAIQAADLNGDGRLDLVVQDSAFNRVFVLLGAAGGQFTPLPPQVTGSTATGGQSLALADLNGDKRVDLIVGNGADNSVSIALGRGDGTFSLAPPVVVDSGGTSVAVGDFNGDGKPDLAVVSNASATVSIFAGTGGGTFQPPQIFPGGIQPLFVLAGDLDNDGRTDLVTVSPAVSTVTVVRNTTGSTAPNSPLISLSASRLQLTLVPNGPPPASPTISITNGGSGVLAWTAASTVPWLTLLPVPPTSPPPPSPLQLFGTAPSMFFVIANPNGLQPGVYNGAITVSGAGAANSPQTLLVTLTLPGGTSPPPAATPFVTAVQNSASYSRLVAQGSIFIVKGQNLGPAQLLQAPAGSLPTQLGGTSVQVNVGGAAVSCPIFYTSASQIAAILPSSTPIGSGNITVSFNGQTGFPNGITVVGNGVGIYTVASSGIGTGILTGVDYITKTLTKPARPGEVVIAWATGLGAINGNDATVAAIPQQFTNIEVLVGSQPAVVIGASRSGCCAGLDQIAFQVPPATLGCFVPVSIRLAGGAVGAGGSSSNFVTLPVSTTGEPCSNPAPGLPAALVSKVASGQQVSLGLLAVGPGPVIRDVAPSLGFASAASTAALAGQLSKALHIAVPQADVISLLSAYRSGDIAGVRKILARYGSALKSNPSARKLLRSAAVDITQQQAAASSFGLGTGLALVGPEFASDSPPVGTCSIGQNFPGDPSASTSGLDAGSVLTVSGPAGVKTISQASPGQYSGLLGAGPSTTNTTMGFYTVSGTGGKNIGPFSVSLNVANPLTWTNKSAVNIIDRTHALTVTWSGGAVPGHVIIGGTVKSSIAGGAFPSATGALLLCTEDAQKGTFTIPQFVLSALSGGHPAVLFIAPHPLDNIVTIPGLDLAFLADGSSDSRTVMVQ